MTRLAPVTVGGKVTASIENADRAGINKTQQLMTPTSAVNGTVGTYGSVTFSVASSLSVNGCFTSEFDWYEIIIDITTSGAAILNMALRLSGTDAATNYDSQRLTATNTTVAGAQTLAGTAWPLTVSGLASRSTGSLKLLSPALATATAGNIKIGSTPNPMTTSAVLYEALWQHRTATAYDGFTMTPSTGTITGAVRVYGII